MFTDKQGHSETHIFDNSGSTVSVLNSNGTKGSTASKGGKVTVDNSSATEEDGYYQYLGTTSLKVENPTSEDNTAFFTGFALMITHWATSISIRISKWAEREYRLKLTVQQSQIQFRFQMKTEHFALHSIFTTITAVHLSSIIRTLVLTHMLISRYHFL